MCVVVVVVVVVVLVFCWVFNFQYNLITICIVTEMIIPLFKHCRLTTL